MLFDGMNLRHQEVPPRSRNKWKEKPKRVSLLPVGAHGGHTLATLLTTPVGSDG